jgi:hypothetical protein
VTRAEAARIADRKALLAARAALDRAQITLATQEIRAIVAPPREPGRAGSLRPAASLLVAIGAPFFGVSRLGRWLRLASWALVALRIARNWRAAR